MFISLTKVSLNVDDCDHIYEVFPISRVECKLYKKASVKMKKKKKGSQRSEDMLLLSLLSAPDVT